MSRLTIKSKILLKQNWLVFVIFFSWFIINYFVFSVLTNGNYIESLLIIFYFIQHSSLYGNFYPIMSEFFIFSILFSIITTGFFRKYNPRQTALALARSQKDHTVIIGYSHLAKRIREYLIKNKMPYVIIEPNEDLIQDLIEEECPVIIRKIHELNVLKDANVQDAKLIFTAKNDLETLIVSTGLIREINKYCKIVSRCFDDSIAKILEKTYNCETISTSKFSCRYIMDEIKKLNVTSTIIIGWNNTTKRLISNLKSQGITYTIIERDRRKVVDIIDDEPIIIGDGKDKDNLQEAGIDNIHMIIILIDKADEVLLISDSIRELNQKCDLICRFFHEDVGEILERPPFNANVISLSKHALDSMIKEGLFNS